MTDKTPEAIIALAKQCAAVSFGEEVTFQTIKQLQAFAALTAAQPVQPAAENKSSAPVEFWRLLAEYVEALDEERRDAIEHRFDELFALANHEIDKALEILNEHAPHTSGQFSVRVAQLCLVSPRDAQPVQPATPDLQKAAQAVLDRWNSPKWEWGKQGPTADLMYDLRSAIEADHNISTPEQKHES